MSTPNQMIVLYVDQNPDNCEMMSALLGMHDVNVVCVHRIAEALDFAASAVADLYLIASRFEDGSAPDLCRKLRHLDAKTPIVFYSGDAYQSDRYAAFAAGATAFVTKPNVETIGQTVLDLINDRGARLFGQTERENLAAYFPASPNPQFECAIMAAGEDSSGIRAAKHA